MRCQTLHICRIVNKFSGLVPGRPVKALFFFGAEEHGEDKGHHLQFFPPRAGLFWSFQLVRF